MAEFKLENSDKHDKKREELYAKVLSPSTGDGGTCYGDSGGPHFLGDSGMVVSLTVTGDSPCRASDVTYRLDIESARSYLAQFVTLP